MVESNHFFVFFPAQLLNLNDTFSDQRVQPVKGCAPEAAMPRA